MKHHITALTLFGILAAVPGRASADVVWHCVAHPVGLQADQHDGFGFSEDEAGAHALSACEADHGAGTCEVDWGLCHIDHH